MAVLSEDEIGRRCVAAASALCIVHILTIVGTDYQAYATTRDGWQIDRFQVDQIFLGIYALLVNYGIFLSPVFVLLLIRRVCVLVGIFAIPVLILFTLRMYHVWQFYWFGINSMAVQKSDGWLQLVFEMLSAAIAVSWVLGLLFWKLIDGMRGWRKG
jgi:hypothetical protein